MASPNDGDSDNNEHERPPKYTQEEVQKAYEIIKKYTITAPPRTKEERERARRHWTVERNLREAKPPDMHRENEEEKPRAPARRQLSEAERQERAKRTRELDFASRVLEWHFRNHAPWTFNRPAKLPAELDGAAKLKELAAEEPGSTATE